LVSIYLFDSNALRMFHIGRQR